MVDISKVFIMKLKAAIEKCRKNELESLELHKSPNNPSLWSVLVQDRLGKFYFLIDEHEKPFETSLEEAVALAKKVGSWSATIYF